MPYDPKAAGEAKLTSFEIEMLQSLLNAHDRGGFYMAYAAMSGSQEAVLQASISTFSENLGGIALAANRIIQTWIGPGTAAPGEQPLYPGMYEQSQFIAQAALDAIKFDISKPSGNGYITDKTFLDSAEKAWNDRGVGEYFPGNALVQGNFLSGVDIFTFVANLLVVLRQPNPTTSQFDDFIFQMRGVYDQGVLASILGFFVGGYFEKTDSNVAGIRVVGPDGYNLVVETDGHVTAVLGFDSNDIQAVLGVTGLTAAIGLQIAALPEVFIGTATANLPLFSQYLTNLVWPASAGPIIPAHLTEFYSDGFNGDTQVPAPFVDIDLSRPVWRENATTQSDILYLQDPGSIDGGDGNDVIFGSDIVFSGQNFGKDEIHGGAGDDILWGRGGEDQLFGGAGKDILRGGAGDDTLYGNGETVTGPNGPAPAADNEADFFSGGTGSDTYYVSNVDIINDSIVLETGDGLGQVYFDGELLTGISDPCATRTINYSVDGNNLIVTFVGVDGHSITIEGWKNGDLGIELKQLTPSCGPGPGSPDPFASPIVLDLDGDGLELTSGQNTAVYFDIDGDGIRELTNWVRPDDGLLAFDANGNGAIDGAGELFGYGTSISAGQPVRFFTSAVNGFNDFELQTYTSGYDKLALFDDNEDGIISAADGVAFTGLRFWRDINQDGSISTNELFSLAQRATYNSPQLLY